MHPDDQVILHPGICPKEVLKHVHKEECERSCYSIFC